MMLGLSTPSTPIHVFSIDYRGFGLSTGTPSEEGLITDGVSLLNFLTSSPLNISPSRIVIIGQSLGTAVSAAVAERFAFGSPDPTAIQPALKSPEPFAGVVLMASFSNLPSLIQSYSLKGLTPPMLSPLIGYPRFQKWVVGHIVDNWDTAERVARLTGVGPTAHNDSLAGRADQGLDLSIIHAIDDVEIPWYEGRRVWRAATGENLASAPGSLIIDRKEDSGPGEVQLWEYQPHKGSKAVRKVRWERVGYGGMVHPILGTEQLLNGPTLTFIYRP
jgi:pimeloyl-ACP methyl ester carboxylesterase